MVIIDYTNYRGERDNRRIVPMSIFYGANEWHLEVQWLLNAYDLDKQALRVFSLQNIHSWGRSP